MDFPIDCCYATTPKSWQPAILDHLSMLHNSAVCQAVVKLLTVPLQSQGHMLAPVIIYCAETSGKILVKHWMQQSSVQWFMV